MEVAFLIVLVVMLVLAVIAKIKKGETNNLSISRKPQQKRQFSNSRLSFNQNIQTKIGTVENTMTPEFQNRNEILPTGNTFEEQMKIDLKKALNYERTSLNPKFHRTGREEDLSFNFSQKYTASIGKMEAAIYDSVVAVPTVNLSETTVGELNAAISLCLDAVAKFEKFKKFCYNHGKGGMIYFQDMWEYCHNSKNPCFSYIDQTTKTLEDLNEQLLCLLDSAKPEKADD